MMPNPKIDIIFRKLFGSEGNKDLLISLVNSVVNPNPPIVDLVLRNPYNLADYVDDRESILDIKAEDRNGTQYDIEMQIASHPRYGQRAIYYLARTFAGQISRGDEFTELNTTIGIHFLDFSYFDDYRVLRQFVFKDAETNEAPAELSCIRLYFIEMPKFNKDWPDLQNTFERWVAVLAKAHEIDQDEIPAQLAADGAVGEGCNRIESDGSK